MRQISKPVGTKLEDVTSPITGKSAEIRFEKRAGIFHCEISQDKKSDRDLSVVRQWAMSILNRTDKLEWTPVISVQEKDSDSYYSGSNRLRDLGQYAYVGIQIDRFYVGKTPAGKWRKLEWRYGDADSDDALPDDEKLAHSESWGELADGSTLRLPYLSQRFHGDGSLLAWSEETWTGLTTIIEQIEAQRKLLRRVLNSKEGHKQLAKYGAGDSKALLALPAKSSAR